MFRWQHLPNVFDLCRVVSFHFCHLLICISVFSSLCVLWDFDTFSSWKLAGLMLAIQPLISQPCLVLSSAGISGMCHLHWLIFNINYVDRFYSSLQGIYWFIILFFYCNCFCCHSALFSGNLIPGITKRQSFYYHLTETII